MVYYGSIVRYEISITLLYYIQKFVLGQYSQLDHIYIQESAQLWCLRRLVWIYSNIVTEHSTLLRLRTHDTLACSFLLSMYVQLFVSYHDVFLREWCNVCRIITKNLTQYFPVLKENCFLQVTFTIIKQNCLTQYLGSRSQELNICHITVVNMFMEVKTRAKSSDLHLYSQH